jgi:4-amino-4-deoxy-L-arabinose transferase-like glycosyltransferase
VVAAARRAANTLAPEAWLLLAAIVVRVAMLAYLRYAGLESMPRDLYYNLALGWLGWGPAEPMDATHPPVYSMFLAALMWLLRTPHPLPIMLIQIFLSAFSCLLAIRLGELLHSRRAGWLAGCIMAVDPGLVYIAPLLQTETLFIFMELAFFVLLYRRLAAPSAPGAFGVGLLGGISSLCRSVFAAYPAILLPALLPLLPRRRALVWIAAFSIGWLSPIAVWTARNWALYREIIPTSAQMGWTLYEGFTLDREEIRRRPIEMGAEAVRLGLDSVAAAKHFKEKTVRFVKENPGEAARIVAGKALLYWRPFPYDPYTGWQRLLLGWFYIVLFVLAARGAWAVRRDFRRWLPVFGFFAYMTAMHAIFFTSLRYRLPLEPFLCLLAAAGFKK